MQLFSIFFFLLLAISVNGQVFSGNPSSVHWKKVDSRDTRVIFPQGNDSLALRVAALSNLITRLRPDSGQKQKKINIVLQDRTTISNAYVGLAPFRSEFYLNAPQNSFLLGSLPWAENLVLHEYRHVEQFRNFDVGLSHTLRVIFGEAAQALANNAAIPDWYFEGDAVYQETKLSGQGRGRLSYFFNPFRGLWLSDKQYSWIKLRNGSLKDFVPGHYELGYMLVAYGYQRFGDDFWRKVTGDAASYKTLFYPFQHAIERYSGQSYKEFRNAALTFFQEQFKEKSWSGRAVKGVLNEQYPAFTPQGIVYVQSGYDQRPELILKKDGSRKVIRLKDISIDNHFSYKKGKIVYSAIRPDIRWGNVSYNDLKIVDVATGRQTVLTHHTRYFSPSFDDNATRIVVVEQPAKGRTLLKIVDARTGEILQTLPNKEGYFFTYPVFADSSLILSSARDTLGRMALLSISMIDGATSQLTPWSKQVIGFPVIKEDTIFFTAQVNQQDELLALKLSGRQLLRLSMPASGAGKYQPAVSNGFIAWSTFTPHGFKLEKISRDSAILLPIEDSLLADGSTNFNVTALQNGENLLTANQSLPDLSIGNYSKGYQLFNFHSIQPSASDPEYGLFLLGENILNTFQSTVGVVYDRSERSKRLSAGAAYGGLYPIISGGVDYTFDRKSPAPGGVVYSFSELEPFIGLNIPLNFSQGRHFTFLNVGSRFIYNQTFTQGALKDSVGNISYSYLNNYFSFSNQVQPTRKQIFPAFAQSVSASFKKALTKYHDWQFATTGSIYLPGFSKNHSLVINGAFLQRHASGGINFSGGFPFSRGFTGVTLKRMIKGGLNYHFPFAYPDWGFGGILYFLRLRGNVFYDVTITDDEKVLRAGKADFLSTGAEMFFDTKWWNQVDVSFGVRYARLLTSDLFGGAGRNRLEIVLPVNIFR